MRRVVARVIAIMLFAGAALAQTAEAPSAGTLTGPANAAPAEGEGPPVAIGAEVPLPPPAVPPFELTLTTV